MDNPKDTLLSQWLHGKLSQEEQEALGQTYDLERLEAILSMQQKLAIDKVTPSEDIWSHIQKETSSAPLSRDTKSRSLWPYIGLGLAILLAALYWFLSPKSQIDNTPAGQTETIQFADNTQIILAPLSQIRYNTDQWSKERKIHLDGHAHFNVSKGSTFTVHGDHGLVTVLGTQFEIWQSKNQMHIQCTEGSIKVADKNSDSIVITGGQEVSISNNKLGTIGAIRQEKGFINDLLIYDQIDIDDIALEIKRFYNIDVTYNLVDEQVNYTGVFPLDDLEKAISYIAKTMQWDYEIMPGDKVIFKD